MKTTVLQMLGRCKQRFCSCWTDANNDSVEVGPIQTTILQRLDRQGSGFHNRCNHYAVAYAVAYDVAFYDVAYDVAVLLMMLLMKLLMMLRATA